MSQLIGVGDEDWEIDAGDIRGNEADSLEEGVTTSSAGSFLACQVGWLKQGSNDLHQNGAVHI